MTMTWTDPILEEIHQIREAHAAKFNYDIEAIVKDFQEKQKSRGKPIVSFVDKSKAKANKRLS